MGSPLASSMGVAGGLATAVESAILMRKWKPSEPCAGGLATAVESAIQMRRRKPSEPCGFGILLIDARVSVPTEVSEQVVDARRASST